MTLSAVESNKGNFVVNVKVTNNSPNKDQGRINVRIDGSDESNTVSAQFPAKKTITKTFLFKGNEVPIGKGFIAEVRWDDDYNTGVNDVNSPKKGPELVEIRIP